MQRHFNDLVSRSQRSMQNGTVDPDDVDENKSRSLLGRSLQSPLRRSRLTTNSSASERILMNTVSSVPLVEDASSHNHSESSATLYTDGQDLSSRKGDDADSASESDYIDRLVASYRTSMGANDAKERQNLREGGLNDGDEGEADVDNQQSTKSLVYEAGEKIEKQRQQQPKAFVSDEKTTSFEEGLYSSSENSQDNDTVDDKIGEVDKIYDKREDDVLPIDVHAVNESLERVERPNASKDDLKKSLRFLKNAIQGTSSPSVVERLKNDEPTNVLPLSQRDASVKNVRGNSLKDISSNPSVQSTQSGQCSRISSKTTKTVVLIVALLLVSGVILLVVFLPKMTDKDEDAAVIATLIPTSAVSRNPTIRKAPVPTETFSPTNVLIPSYSPTILISITQTPTILNGTATIASSVFPTQSPSTTSSVPTLTVGDNGTSFSPSFPPSKQSLQPSLQCLDQLGAIFVNNTIRTCEAIASSTSVEIRLWCQFAIVSSACVSTCDNCPI